MRTVAHQLIAGQNDHKLNEHVWPGDAYETFCISNSFAAYFGVMLFGIGYWSGSSICRQKRGIAPCWSEHGFASLTLLRLDAVVLLRIIQACSIDSQAVRWAKAAGDEAMDVYAQLGENVEFRVAFEEAAIEHGLMEKPAAREAWLSRARRFEDEFIYHALFDHDLPFDIHAWGEPVSGWRQIIRGPNYVYRYEAQPPECDMA